MRQLGDSVYWGTPRCSERQKRPKKSFTDWGPSSSKGSRCVLLLGFHIASTWFCLESDALTKARDERSSGFIFLSTRRLKEIFPGFFCRFELGRDYPIANLGPAMKPVAIDYANAGWKPFLKDSLQEGRDVNLSNFDYTIDGQFCEMLALAHDKVFTLDFQHNAGMFRKKSTLLLGGLP